MAFFKNLFKQKSEPAKEDKVVPPPAPARENHAANEPVDLSLIDWNDAGEIDFFHNVVARHIDDGLIRFLNAAPFGRNALVTPSDAAILYGVVCNFEPTRMMEVGGGYSTLVIRHAKVTKMLPGELIVVDPTPAIDIIELVDAHLTMNARDVTVQDYQTLQSGEMLVIDLARACAVKADADFLFHTVLPKLNNGVLVGLHGAGPLPRDVAMFLSEKYRAEILFSAEWMKDHHADLLREKLAPLGGDTSITSLWFRIK